MTGQQPRRVLVTGGYGAIGRAIAVSLAAQGAAVAVAGRSLDKATALAEELSGTGAKARGHCVDVADRADVERLVGAVVADWGGIDVLVNCASALTVTPAEDFAPDDWRTVVDVNLVGAFWLSQAVGRVMIESGGGAILHFSSVRGSAGASRGFTAYGASKAGLNLLVKQLATEWGKYGITVNAVAPGFVRTEFVADAGNDPRFMKMVEARTPLGRTAEIQEVADAALYLISERAGFVTGQILYVDGGVSSSQ